MIFFISYEMVPAFHSVQHQSVGITSSVPSFYERYSFVDTILANNNDIITMMTTTMMTTMMTMMMTMMTAEHYIKDRSGSRQVAQQIFYK